MTDKEKLEAIRAEIERLIERAKAERVLYPKTMLAAKNYLLIEDYNKLLSFIDSMQEEPVSGNIDFEQELYKAFGQVKDFTLGIQIAKWFYDMGKNNGKEPVSEGLKEAADEYATGYNLSGRYKIIEAFKAGAQWQLNKISKKYEENRD